MVAVKFVDDDAAVVITAEAVGALSENVNGVSMANGGGGGGNVVNNVDDVSAIGIVVPIFDNVS